MRQWTCSALAIVIVWTAGASDATAHGGGILVQQQDGKLVTGFDSEQGSREIGVRAFSLLFPPSTLAIDVPSFLSLANAPAGTEPLPQGMEVRFDLMPMTIDGATSNLFYWDGQGSNPQDVSFGAVPQEGVTLTLYDPDFVATFADGSSTMTPGRRIGTTTTSADNLRLHAHRYFFLDDGDENAATAPPDGIYLMALQLRMEGLRNSDPIYVAAAGFQTLTPAVIDALEAAALPWVAERVDTLILDGDYDFNGVVDGGDLLQWQRHYAYDGPFPIDGVDPDGDGDGAVNGPDLAVWQDNFGSLGASSGAAIAAVPEPSSFLLLAMLVGLASVVGERLRRTPT